MSVRRAGPGKFVIRYLDGGKKGVYRSQLVYGTFAEAKRLHDRQKGEAAKRAILPGRVTFGQIADRYLEVHAPKLSPRWRSQVEAIVRGKLVPRFGTLLAQRLKSADIVRYWHDEGRNVKASVLGREAALLMKLLNFAEGEELIDRNPVSSSKMPRYKAKVRTRALDSEEWTRLRTALDDPKVWEEHRASVRTLGQVVVNPAAALQRIRTRGGGTRRGTVERRYGGGLLPGSPASHKLRLRMRSATDFFAALLVTACRLSELLDLRWSSIDRRSGTVSISLPKTTAKGIRVKVLPLVSGLKTLIDRQPAGVGDAFVFRDPETGKQWTVPRLTRAFKIAVKLASLEGAQVLALDRLVIHSLRHTAETWLARADISEAKRNAYLGHTERSIASRYTHLLPADLAPLVELLSTTAGIEPEGTAGDVAGDVLPVRANRETL